MHSLDSAQVAKDCLLLTTSEHSSQLTFAVAFCYFKTLPLRKSEPEPTGECNLRSEYSCTRDVVAFANSTDIEMYSNTNITIMHIVLYYTVYKPPKRPCNKTNTGHAHLVICLQASLVITMKSQSLLLLSLLGVVIVRTTSELA